MHNILHVNIAYTNICQLFTTGRPDKAARYALKVSRSVVVTLSLSPLSGI